MDGDRIGMKDSWTDDGGMASANETTDLSESAKSENHDGPEASEGYGSTATGPGPFVYDSVGADSGVENSIMASENYDEDDDDDDGIEGSSLDEEWPEDDEDLVTPPPPPRFMFLSPIECLISTWTAIKALCIVVANVENLWDTPPDPRHVAMTTSREHRRRNQMIVLFWFVVLAVSYASERSSYKLLVDRTGPFRLLAAEMVTATHALMICLFVLIQRCCFRHTSGAGNNTEPLGLGIPVIDVGLMAILDTANLLIVFLSGYHVPPTLTVILIQFTLPLTAFSAPFVHPQGRCNPCRNASDLDDTDLLLPDPTHDSNSPGSAGRSHTSGITSNETRSTADRSSAATATSSAMAVMASAWRQDAPPPMEHRSSFASAEEMALPGLGGLTKVHIWGSLIIILAVLVALCPAFHAIADPDLKIFYGDTIPIRTALNTLLYLSSCIPAAASQLYKEHIFVQYKQPVDAYQLNLLLSVFQFVFTSALAPIVFSAQGFGDTNWTTVYPSSMMVDNFMDGLRCFCGVLNAQDQEHKYTDDAECDYSVALVFLYALSIILVGVAVDKIVNAGATKVMYRGISAGIILAVICMRIYDMHLSAFNYGPAIDFINLISLLLLILGSEVYHRVSLKESTFETVFPEIHAYGDVG